MGTASRSAKYWREASTLMLAAKLPKSFASVEYPPALHKLNFPQFDYNLLMLKRSKHSRFLPSAHVFPGGVTSDVDFSHQWEEIFRSVSGKTLANVASELACSGPRPPCIREETPGMPSDVAFRICAIRETFEECGVLLAMTKTQLKERSQGSQNIMTRAVDYALLRDWRKEVEKDEQKFLNLCQELQVVPDVWALSEWCNWLTPVMRPVSKAPERPTRYDTMFYFSSIDIDGLPYTQSDDQEAFAPVWHSPPEYIGYSPSKFKILGPQLLELGRMCHFPSFSQLGLFAQERSKLGTERWMNGYVECQDGVMCAMPGDEMNPDDSDYKGTSGKWPMKVDATSEQLTDGVVKMNRVFRSIRPFDSPHDNRPFLCTVKPKLGHLSPMSQHGILKSNLIF